ncbi:MAG: hypothetical protein HY901_22470, partial [Deltaproteobacteria bacterium]|nr:hypothetical protein [Deltaproteobacteria bacterium]
ANPHVFETPRQFDLSLSQGPVPEAGESDGIATVGAPVLRRVGAGAWTEFVADEITQRSDLAMAYDNVRGVVVAFGGYRMGGSSSETWEWNGRRWSKAAPLDPEGDGSPNARLGHALAFDSRRGRTVLFGGCLAGSASNCTALGEDTWEYDGASWKKLDPAHIPDGRYRHAMAYDTKRAVVVLFGGFGGAALSDTWEWNGSDWAEIAPGGSIPAPRVGHAMAYDSARGFVTLFGGCSDVACSSYRAGTSEYDGTSWYSRTAATSPSARWRHVMVFDIERGAAVLHGGFDGSSDCDGSGGGTCSGTWEWSGTAWVKRTPADPGQAQLGHAAAYDSARKRMVLFGGSSNGSSTWEYNGSTWTQRSPKDADPPDDDGNPSGRCDHFMAFSSARSRTLLFGGSINGTFLALSDTWEFDGLNWAECTTTSGTCVLTDPEADGAPTMRYGHAMALDSTGKIVLFGGTVGDPLTFCDGVSGRTCGVTWVWNKNETTHEGSWAKCTTTSSFCRLTDTEGDGNPAARTRHALAYDSIRGRTVLFGGQSSGLPLADTWEWNGSTRAWVKSAPATSPPARFWSAMAFDSVRQKTVLFGGCLDSGCASVDASVWEWTGPSGAVAGTWASVTPTDPEGDGNPSARYGQSLVYDSQRRRVMLYGGANEVEGALNDTWEWNGTSWLRRFQAESFETLNARSRHAAVFDSARSLMLVQGGIGTGSPGNDNWEWNGGYSSQPGFQMKVSFGSAALSSTPAFQSISVRVDAGGTSGSGSISYSGFQLRIWEDGLWKTQRTDTTSIPSSPGTMQWQTSDTARMWRLFEFPDQEQYLNLAVTPRYGNGRALAEIALDYAEVMVRYKVP